MAPKNKDELTRQFEFHFSSYLKWLKCTQEEKDFIKSLIKSKWWILWVLWIVHGGEIFKNSHRTLTMSELRNFLDKLSEIGKTVYENMSEEDINHWTYEWELAVAIWGKYLFWNDAVRFQDIIRMENFFRWYLANKFILLSPESKKKIDGDHNGYQIAQIVQGVLLKFAVDIEHIAWLKVWAQLTDVLHVLLQNANQISLERWNSFLEKIQNWSSQVLSEENAKILLNIVSEALTEIMRKEWVKTKVKSILLWDFHKKWSESFEFRFIPENNFYFRKSEEIFCWDNVFPESGSFFYTADTLQNICIFDPNGNKVYWWDLCPVHIEKIMGTYYVLDEQKWWKKVPKYAKGNIVSLVQATDPYLETFTQTRPELVKQFVPKDVPYLLPEYMRAFALGKIEHGTYIENPKKISY